MAIHKEMEVVGSFEAKTHLAQLLRKVESGSTIRISQHGRPVADLVPISKKVPSDAAHAVSLMKAFAQNATTLKKGASIKELIEFGRK